MLTKFFLIVFGLTIASADIVVQTSKGKVRGTVLESYNNKSFYAFMGIPFAKPPVGNLRFQPPQSTDPWEGVFDNRGVKRNCVQIFPTISPVESEDCLYLHVYTPQLPSEQNNSSLPVMFVVHGGAFVEGTATLKEMGPHYLMDYDIIVVSVSYRLGFFGFVSTSDLICPGNNGLKDQVFGLKWVYENIQQFGGDPNRITIFGESAGAASIGYLLLSPKSSGLFRGAIQDSGSAISPWMLQRDPKKITYAFAKAIDSSIDENTSSQELMDLFQNLTISEVKRASNEVFGTGMIEPFFKTSRGFLFGGTIEPKHDGAFLDDYPYEKLVSGNFNSVPTLIGINSQETLFLLADKNLTSILKSFDENPEMMVAPDMHVTDLRLLKSIGEDIRKIYVNNSKLQDNLEQAITYISDATFGRSALKQAEITSSYTDVYFYEYAYDSSKNEYPVSGVVHGGEMANLFTNQILPPTKKSPADIATMKRMQIMWTNFVKYLNPTPEPLELLQNITWPTTSSNSDRPYLLINETLEVKYYLKKSMVDEYARLYNTYAVPPLDVY